MECKAGVRAERGRGEGERRAWERAAPAPPRELPRRAAAPGPDPAPGRLAGGGGRREPFPERDRSGLCPAGGTLRRERRCRPYSCRRAESKREWQGARRAALAAGKARGGGGEHPPGRGERAEGRGEPQPRYLPRPARRGAPGVRRLPELRRGNGLRASASLRGPESPACTAGVLRRAEPGEERGGFASKTR